MFIILGNSNYVIIFYETDAVIDFDSKYWVAKIVVVTTNKTVTFYVLNSKNIPFLAEGYQFDYRTVWLMFTSLLLTPEEHKDILLVDEIGSEWFLGSFFDLYIFNYFRSSKVDCFTKNWSRKCDGISKPKIDYLHITEFNDLENKHNSYFNT